MTALPRVLVSWIGRTDLAAFAPHATAAGKKEVLAYIKNAPPPSGGVGPLLALLKNQAFDAIHLISPVGKAATRSYLKWVGRKADVRYHVLKDPTDYVELFTLADSFLAEVTSELQPRKHDLSIHLSPGTPAMAAVWVLLGKTRYPARFWQAFDGRAAESQIPFDITLDFVPEILRAADHNLQQMSARPPSEVAGFESIVGDSSAIRQAVERARRVAARSVPVLLLGESGTGKEMFARAIHDASARRDGPYLAVNCAAMPKELLESELFGHVAGSFTGAVSDRDGLFKRADGGTLFLDEVGECGPEVQAKLLRVLQPPLDESPCTREFQPVGSQEYVRSDVRIVAATNRDFRSMIEREAFREDLHYRLAVFTIKLPPLRDRPSDIPKIADRLLQQINRDFAADEPGYRPRTLSPSAKNLIRTYSWPGNVRELQNVLIQAAVMCDSTTIRPLDLKPAMTDQVGGSVGDRNLLGQPIGNGFSLDDLVATLQRHYLRRAIDQAHGVKSHAAGLLGFKHYQTLDQRMKRFGVDLD